MRERLGTGDLKHPAGSSGPTPVLENSDGSTQVILVIFIGIRNDQILMKN